MKKTKASPSANTFPTQSKDLPATHGMLHLVRSEVKSDIRELRSEMNAQFRKVDARFNQVDARIEELTGAIHRLEGTVSRIGILVEEQNSRNQVVLEGLTGLYQRQDRLESRMDDVDSTVRSIARARS